MAKKKNPPAAVALGRLGGAAKVPRGLSTLTPEERSAIAKQGATKRWADLRAAYTQLEHIYKALREIEGTLYSIRRESRAEMAQPKAEE
jgi:hypothetical protein